jgi:hypothetical protein
MKTGRYSAATQAAWDTVRAQILTAIQTMPSLTYKKIGQLFDCSEGCVAGIAKKANVKRPQGRRTGFTVHKDAV